MTVNKETNSKLRNGKDRKKNPVKAIREFCLECCGYNPYEVAKCTAEQCSLWCFRDGHNPYRTKELTDEQREEIANRCKAMREKRRNAENV